MGNSNEKALVNSRLRFSFAWIIPLLALIVTGIMLWDNTLNKGPEIELVVASADGIEAGKTLVKYRSVTVGRVESVEIEDDLRSVRLGIRMNPGTDNLLLKDSKFWVVKPRIDTNSISGLDTLLSGSYIQISLGSSNEHAEEFVAEAQPPVNPYNEAGVTVNLFSHGTDSIPEGTVVEYKGIEVGVVASSRLNPKTDTFEYQLFIRKPYDDLLKGNIRFWNDTGIDLKIDGSGLNISTKSLLSVMQGTVTFEGFGYRNAEESLDLSKTYELFVNRTAAENETLKSYPKYLINVGHDAGAIKAGSDVLYRGVLVGKVVDPAWKVDDLDIIYPEDDIYVLMSFLTFSDSNESATMKFFNDSLAENNVCATFTGSSLLSGNNAISIEIGGKVKCKAKEKEHDGIRVIPLMEGNNTSPQTLMNEILAEIKGMKLEETAAEARNTLIALQKATANLSKTLDNAEQQKVIDEFNKTVKQFHKTMAGFDEKGKLYQEMSQLIGQLNQSLKDLKPAVKDVGQKPNSIIFSDTTGDPIPGQRSTGDRK
ncbi:MAG TPA: hypothetical protein DCR21_07450 [Succinivibrionaceae bacterium]|nr:hypothetical protein [Succinivibrionaceae bacterium]